jgi:hypothetical protein
MEGRETHGFSGCFRVDRLGRVSEPWCCEAALRDKLGEDEITKRIVLDERLGRLNDWE